MGVTRTLAKYISQSRYEDIPHEVVNQAKLAVLNILAAALGGCRTEIGKRHVRLAVNTAGKIEESTLIGEGCKVSCPFGAYANGNLAFALDYEDVVRYTLHAGPIVIPAALAVSEKMGASGKDFLNAVVLGYEAGTRIGLAMQPSAERGSRVWGQQYSPFAACISAGKLMGFDAEKMDAAFGVAGTYATVPSAYKYFGIVPETRPMREVKLGWGWMSMIGVFAAMSVQEGFGGGYGILDGDEGFWIMAGSDRCEFDEMTRNLGEQYLMMETEFKIHPSIAWNHPPHTALKAFVEKHDIRPVDIGHIKVKGLGAERIADYDPAGPVDAMFSLPYTIATTITRDPLGPELYSEEKMKDPVIRDLLKRIEIQPDPAADRLWFEEHREVFNINVFLQDGRQYDLSVEYPADRPEVTQQDIESKFRALAYPTLDRETIDRVVDTVARLDAVRNITDLTRLL